VATAPGRSLRPLTERILGRLPGPSGLWVAAWALVPWLNAGANLLLSDDGTSAVWEQSGTLVVLNYVALSLAVAIALWGTGRIARRVDSLRTAEEDDPFRGMYSAAGPLLLTAAAALAFAVSAFVRDGWAAALLRGATWIVIGVGLFTYFWTYASVLIGLDRLGRHRLPANAARADPSLGLRPLGDVAFMGLWMLLALLVPVVLTGVPDVVGVVIGVLVLAAALAAFFLSLLRLHRRMVELKAGELAAARSLYAQAYEPVQTEGTLDALDRQRQLLSAADGLEQRARAIHEWPIDDGTVARVLTIATSVVAISVARLILDPIGL
jgi:hypothetical protein